MQTKIRKPKSLDKLQDFSSKTKPRLRPCCQDEDLFQDLKTKTVSLKDHNTAYRTSNNNNSSVYISSLTS